MAQHYALGIDYGTLSARAVLVDTRSGEEKGELTFAYPSGVIEGTLPGCGTKLPGSYALQDPADYRNALEYLLSNLWKKAGVDPRDICAIGVDFTACTVLPVDEAMQPLCEQEQFRSNPHSWTKLWKHHGAQAEATRILELAAARGEDFLKPYGDQCSSEWYVPKLLELYRKAPEIYKAAYRFVNAGDWVNYLMTGELSTSACTAGYKCFWNPVTGYPDRDFLEALEPGFGSALEEKMGCPVLPMGKAAGYLTEEMAQKTGLCAGIPVASAAIDAHAALPAVGIRKSGALLMSMGTSLCHMMVSENQALVPGISGVVEGGILPGLYGYEAGQVAVGDIYAWFARNLVADPDPMEAMTKKAAEVPAGSNGLVALDWWNGNRSILSNSDLTGMIMGMTLNTKPEEIYRALVEATAFGARTIVQNFVDGGVAVNKIFACGGLAEKSPLVMQIFADVLGQTIYVSNIVQTTAYGSAMYAMAALGKEKGGYDTLEEAAEALIRPARRTYVPNPETRAVYDRLYTVYRHLHDYFGVEHPEIMLALKNGTEV